MRSGFVMPGSNILRGTLTSLALAAFSICASVRADDQPVASAAAPKIADAGGPVIMRRLTAAQYRNIITDVFGATIRLGGRFEPDLRVDHLIAVGSGKASVTASGIEQYDAIARSIGEQVVDPAHRAQLIGCKPAVVTAPDDSCARKFLGRVGRLLFRRPLTHGELDAYVAVAAAVTRESGDFYDGLALALGGVLESPQFLYRQEFAVADPAHPGTRLLDAYSIASRLSFLFWNTSPDPALLAAAEKGELRTEKGRRTQVDRLLSSERLQSGVRAFFSDMLEFDGFDTLAKDTVLYPKFTSGVAAEAQEQTLRTLIQLLIVENGDYRDAFTTQKTFLTPLLASLYRVPLLAPVGMRDPWVPYEFAPAAGQSGILTQISFVALHSHPGRSSPTVRGKALRELLLCSRVPDPPGNVSFTIVQDTSNPQYKTARARLQAHANEPMCKGCHRITDPIGLALETFDTTGSSRATENGVKIDGSGELDGVKFADASGLGKAMHDNPRASSCLVRRAYDYGLGREETKSEEAWRIGFVEKQFAADDYRLPGLLRRLTLSDTFYRVIPEADVKAQTLADNRTPAEIRK